MPLTSNLLTRLYNKGKDVVDKGISKAKEIRDFYNETKEPLHPILKQNWPELEASWSGRQIEKPEHAAKVKNIREVNFLEKLHGEPGYTWPNGTIALNKEAIAKSGMSLDEVLVHEMEHAKQNTPLGLLKKLYNTPSDLMTPYHLTSTEKPAFHAQYNRKVKTQSPHLPDPDRAAKVDALQHGRPFIKPQSDVVETPGYKDEVAAFNSGGLPEVPSMREHNKILRRYYDSMGWK